MPDDDDSGDWVILDTLIRPGIRYTDLDIRQLREYALANWSMCAQLSSFIGHGPWRLNCNARGEQCPIRFHNDLASYRVCKHQAERYVRQRWNPMPRAMATVDGWTAIAEDE